MLTLIHHQPEQEGTIARRLQPAGATGTGPTAPWERGEQAPERCARVGRRGGLRGRPGTGPRPAAAQAAWTRTSATSDGPGGSKPSRIQAISHWARTAADQQAAPSAEALAVFTWGGRARAEPPPSPNFA